MTDAATGCVRERLQGGTMGLFQAQKRRAPVLPVLTLLGLGVFAAVPAVARSLIFNGGFHPGHKAWPSPATVASLRTSGWTCPDSEQWPSWLTAAGSNVTFEVFPEARASLPSSRCGRLTDVPGLFVQGMGRAGKGSREEPVRRRPYLYRVGEGQRSSPGELRGLR